MKWPGYVTILFVIAVATACRKSPEVVYSEYAALGYNGWSPNYIISFTPDENGELKDSTSEYILLLNIRFDKSKSDGISVPVSIPITISELNDGEEIRVIDHSIRIRDNEGRPRGKEGLIMHEICDTLDSNLKLPEGYSIDIRSLLPQKYTIGLTDIGITLIKKINDESIQ